MILGTGFPSFLCFVFIPPITAPGLMRAEEENILVWDIPAQQGMTAGTGRVREDCRSDSYYNGWPAVLDWCHA